MWPGSEGWRGDSKDAGRVQGKKVTGPALRKSLNLTIRDAQPSRRASVLLTDIELYRASEPLGLPRTINQPEGQPGESTNFGRSPEAEPDAEADGEAE